RASARWSGGSWTRSCPARSSRPRPRRAPRSAPDGPIVRETGAESRWRRSSGLAEITVRGPATAPAADAAGVHAAGAAFWPLALARELDDLILHLRTNEEEIGLWVVKTTGDADRV